MRIALWEEVELRALIEGSLRVQLAELEARLVARLTAIDRRPVEENGGPRMFTEKELAEMLRCHPRTIRRLERSGELPRAVRIGGSKRWRFEDLKRWLDGLRP